MGETRQPLVATAPTTVTIDSIPTAEPVVVGNYDVGNTLTLPENVSPGLPLTLQTPHGDFVVHAPPTVKPGMQVC